jgi:copper resistance protein D
MLEAGLITARMLHYAAVMALFGVALFPLYAFRTAGGSVPPHDRDWSAKIIFIAAAAAFVTAIFWLQCVTANMVGLPAAAIDPDALASVVSGTAFGRLWRARLGLAVLLLALAAYSSRASKTAPTRLVAALLSGALLASVAGTGHTMLSDGADHTLHVLADALHLLAAGAWLGGLICLGFVMAKNAGDVRVVLIRFSGMGTIAVAVLVGSGLINTWYLVGSVSNLVGTTYGQLLMLKLAVFVAMLALAAANKFWLVPALSSGADDAEAATMRLRRHVFAEQVLGGVVILIVSVLGTLEPAVG